VRGTYRQTQLFYWLIIGRFTTTCFGPIPGPSSGCITNLEWLYYMLLIGNGCFGELSLLPCVIMVCVFFLIPYIIILLPGLIVPVLSCKYNTYHILLNIYVQLFYLLVFWSG